VGGKILSHIDRPGYNTRQLSPERPRRPPNIAAGIPAPSSNIRRNSDAAFSTFYGAFESVFSKLSAPLAFAGLPLTAEQALAETAKTIPKKEEKTRALSSDEPDLTRIYSKAAMQAIREDAGPAFGPQESFYLVPPTGGTVSYAGILTGGRDAHAHSRNAAHVPETIDEDADEFVDARENFGPPSPRSLRNSRKGDSPSASRGGTRKSGSGKTMEELDLENKMLKKLLDTQAQRLQMWEMSSQSQSMALQQSIRAARPPPSLPNTISDPKSFETAASGGNDKVQELEELLRAEKAEREALDSKSEKIARDNEKLQLTVGRYREKWEQLKAGARRRENDKKNASGGSSRPEAIGEASEEG
jgi:hypothetical protein